MTWTSVGITCHWQSVYIMMCRILGILGCVTFLPLVKQWPGPGICFAALHGQFHMRTGLEFIRSRLDRRVKHKPNKETISALGSTTRSKDATRKHWGIATNVAFRRYCIGWRPSRLEAIATDGSRKLLVAPGITTWSKDVPRMAPSGGSPGSWGMAPMAPMAPNTPTRSPTVRDSKKAALVRLGFVGY